MIRLARAGDAAGILAIYVPVVRESCSSFELEPPTEAPIPLSQLGPGVLDQL